VIPACCEPASHRKANPKKLAHRASGPGVIQTMRNRHDFERQRPQEDDP
jgi:hypothetical protein